MSPRDRAVSGTLLDLGVTLFQLAHIILVSFFVDAAGNGETLRIAVSIYLPSIHSAITIFLLFNAYATLGTKNGAKKNPETLLSLICEVFNVVMMFGLFYNLARNLSLPSTDPFFLNSYLHNSAESIFECSMVQAGVGTINSSPNTLSERIVLFCAAYLGGVLLVNMFLLNVLFGRRFWASLPDEKEQERQLIPSAPPPPMKQKIANAVAANWKLESIIASKA
jgi:predicted secreted protein